MPSIKKIYDNLPLRTKLIVIQLFTLSTALIFSTAGSVYIYKKIAEEKLNNSIQSTAHTIAENTGSALMFYDKSSAEKTLQSSLDEHKNILIACLFTAAGEYFGSYVSIEGQSETCRYKRNAYKDKLIVSKDKKTITFVTSVVYKGEYVGSLKLVSDRRDIKESTMRFFEIAVVAFLILMIASLYFSVKAKDMIMAPINQLTKSIQRVSKEKDYSHKIKHLANDELGILATEFNEMLQLVQSRENSLKKTSDQLEKKVIERTEELHKATQQAIDASKTKSEFLAKMSHEIRTPMNAILGFAEILSEELKKNKNRKYTSYILSSANSLLKIIDDILDISKVEAGRLEIKENFINLKKIFEDIEKLFEVKLNQKNLKLTIKHDPQLPNLMFLDETRIRQILINLINNAIKFTDKGKIELSSKVEKGLEDFQVNLILSVKDSGLGIPEDQQKKIFGEFVQKEGQDHNKFGGTGLGLAIVKQLTELMNGEINVTSQIGQGSTFSICFKDIFTVKHIKAYKKPDKRKVLNHKIKKGKLLIVDDVDGNRVLLRAYLKDQKLSIIEAENGKKAVEKAIKEMPDLVLMDLKMPVMGGEEAIEILRKNKKTQNIPVLVLTASGMKSDEKRLKLKCAGYLTKPIRKKDLISEIAKFL